MPTTWLITGSSRGFGRKLAEAVLAAGDQLVATARRPEQLDDLVARYGAQVRAVALDVTDAQAARAAVAVAIETFGSLDVVVNNAGYGNVSAFEETTEEDFRAQLDTNLWGVVNVTRAALPVLRRQRSGHILQFSSIGGRITSPGLAAYQTAKWAVEGLSGVIAQEVAPLGIKLTVIEPGGFRTDWAGSSMTVAEVGEDYAETVGRFASFVRDGHDGQQPGDPARAAQAILRLVALEEPPRRLLLGSDAYAYAQAADAASLEEDARWRALSVSTDFGAEPAPEDVVLPA